MGWEEMSSLPETAEKRGVVVIRSGEEVDEADARSWGQRVAFRQRITMYGRRKPPPQWLRAAGSFCPSALSIGYVGLPVGPQPNYYGNYFLKSISCR